MNEVFKLSFSLFFTTRKYIYLGLTICTIFANAAQVSKGDLDQFFKNEQFVKLINSAELIAGEGQDLQWSKLIINSLEQVKSNYPHKLADLNVLSKLINLGMVSMFHEDNKFIDLAHPFIIENLSKLSPSQIQDLLYIYSKIKSHTKKFELIKLLDNPQIAIKNFDMILKQIANSPFADIYCKNPKFIKQALNQKIDLQVTTSKCWKNFLGYFLDFEDFYKYPSQILSIIKDRSLDIEKRLLLSQKYLLSKGDNQEAFNLAWESFTNLKNDKKLRDKILSQLKFIAPRFTSQKNSSLLANKYLSNFPEFLSSYLKTCYFYMNGYKEYSKGNPTPECHDIVMNLKKSKGLPFKPKYFTKLIKAFPQVF